MSVSIVSSIDVECRRDRYVPVGKMSVSIISSTGVERRLCELVGDIPASTAGDRWVSTSIGVVGRCWVVGLEGCLDMMFKSIGASLSIPVESWLLC